MRLPFYFILVFLFSCSKLGIHPEAVKEPPKVFKAAWIKNLDVPYSTGNLPIGLQSPLISEQMLYMGYNGGAMFAYDLSNGREVWQKVEGHPYHSAPISLGKNLIYGNIEGRLFSRDRLSGELAYAVDLGSAIESQPVHFNGRILVHTRNHKIVCLDAETGKILWAYKRSIPFLTTLQRASRPVVLNNKVFVGFADGFVASFTLEEGVLLWESKVVDGNKFIDVDTHPLVFRGKLIVGSQTGQLTVLNPIGGIVERKLPLSVSRTPVIVGNTLVVGTTEGELVVLDDRFNIINRLQVTKHGVTSMGVWKELLIASTTGGELIAVKRDLSEIVEKFNFGHSSSALFGRLEISQGKLAAYSSRNRLYVFE